MSATSSASLSTASAATTPGPGSTPGKEPRRRVDPSDLSRTFLACGLCGELFQEPKLLPCFHSFCRRCLAGYVPDHSLSLACPTCRQHSILPVAGVSALSDNRFVRRLLERIERIGARRLENGHAAKEEGDKGGVGGVGGGASPADLSSLIPKTRDEEDGEDGEEEEFEVTNDTNYDATSGAQDRSAFDSTADDLSADLDNSSSEVFDDHVTGGGGRAGVDGHVTCPAVSALCLRHESSELSRYCVECDTAVCTECLEAEHRKHSVMDLEEFSSSERSSLEKILNNVRDSTKSIDTSLRNIVKTKLKLERQKIEAEECVERSFNAIRESLERKREALLADIESESAAKLKRLDDQEREVTRLKRTIEACSSFVRSCLDGEANLVGMILAKKELSDKLELFCRSNVQLLPEENPFISFNQGKLSALCGLIEESARQSKSPTPVHGTPPANVKKLKTGEARRPAKAERVQKARKPPGVKAQRISSKAGDSADSEASSESSVGASVSVGPQDFGSVVCNSAVPYETTASGEHLRRCFVNVPALVTVTTKNSRGLNVARGGAKLSAKIYALEVGYKGKSEGRGSQGQEATSEAGAASSCETVPDESVAGGGGGGGGKGEEGERVGEAAKDQRVSFQQNCLREDPGADRREDIVTVTKVDEAKEKSVHKRTLVVPEVIDLGDGTYELTFTVTESALKRRRHGNHSTLDVSKTTTSADSGRLTPQSPSVTPCHRELHSSLDKLQQQKKRPKSAPEVLDLLDSVQLEVKLYGQPIKGSPFGLKVRREVAKFPKDQRTPAASSSSYLNSRHSDHSRRHSGTAGIKRAANLTSKPLGSGGNRKPSSASASQNDGPCQRIGVKGHNKGEFMNLQGIAIHEDRIYVADSNGQCVQVFSMEGKCILKFGAKGRSPGQLQRPTGVTCTPDGQHILVSDYENKWVGVYTIEGRFVNRLGQGKLAGPKGVSVDRQGRVVVVDNRSSTVWLYTMSGKIIGKFGARGVCASSGSSSPSASSPSGFITSAEAQARLAGPHFCSVDPEDGDVVVTDFHNHKVKVFSSDGQFKFSFGSAGDGNGQFNAPTGVCVDRQGNILVADWGNSRIQIFDKYGSFLSHIDTSSDPLYGPQGLAISPDNSVVVADSGNHCLKVYKHLFA